jgi:hypothetical protein
VDISTMCTDIGWCGLVRSAWFWVVPPLTLLSFILIMALPIARILHRTERSRWWTIIAFVPLLNLVALWAFAFSRWPKLDRLSS